MRALAFESRGKGPSGISANQRGPSEAGSGGWSTPLDDASTAGHLISEELRPQVGTMAQGGPRARPGARSDELRALAAGSLGKDYPYRHAPVADDARVSPNPDVLEAPLEGELVLLDPVAGTYYGLNETGAVIWSLLRQGRSVGDAAAAVSENFGVELGRARIDIERMIGRLEAAGLVRSGSRVAGSGGGS